MDKFLNVISYDVNYQVSEFQSLISTGDTSKAMKVLESIPERYVDRLARFLDLLNEKELAFRISRNPEHRFELAIHLGHVDDAFALAREGKSNIKLR